MNDNLVIYLMRHGLDDEKYIGGWNNIGLTEEGIKQVEAGADFIAKNINDINIIYHSGLKRTIETAKIINQRLNLPTFILNDLRELNKGTLNGMELNLAKNMFPEYFPAPLIDQRYPNGESLIDLYERVKMFLEYASILDKTLLITHRGFINMIYFILNEIELNYNKTQFNVEHGSIHKLELTQINRIY